MSYETEIEFGWIDVVLLAIAGLFTVVNLWWIGAWCVEAWPWPFWTWTGICFVVLTFLAWLRGRYE